MKKLLQKLFGFRVPILRNIPWTDEDNKALRGFLVTAAGRKLLAKLADKEAMLNAQACFPNVKNRDFAAGKTYGAYEARAFIQELGKETDDSSNADGLSDKDLDELLEKMADQARREPVLG